VHKKVWGLALVAAGVVAGTLPVVAGAGSAAAKVVPAEVRVNQIGYAENASKIAFVMLPAKVASVQFRVSGGGANCSGGRVTTRAAGTPRTGRCTS
jgi:hypothetical protein